MKLVRAAILRLGISGFWLLVFLCLQIAFLGGSALADLLTNRRPSDGLIKTLSILELPHGLQRFDVVSLSHAPQTSDVPRMSRAEMKIALRVPLYSETTLEAVAAKMGDDAAAYAKALSQRERQPPSVRPPIPATGPGQKWYTIGRPIGTPLSGSIRYQANKAPRGWSIQECLQTWIGRRPWTVTALSWEEMPLDLSSLHERDSLGNAAIAEEEAGQNLLRQYVESRKAFVRQVQDVETSLFEHVALEAVRREVTGTIAPSSVFELKGLVISAPKRTPTGGLEVVATTEIEQKMELFQRRDATLVPLSEGLEQEFNDAKKKAAEFLLQDLREPPPISTVFATTSPAKSSWKGSLRLELTGSSDRPEIKRIEWVQKPTLPKSPFLRVEDADENAIFESPNPGLRSAKSVAQEVGTYVESVRMAINDRARWWGPDQEAWRIMCRAITAHGGWDKLKQLQSFSDQIKGNRKFSDGRSFDLRGTWTISLPFRYRQEFLLTSDKFKYTQVEVLNETGFWRVPNGEMRVEDLLTPSGVKHERTRVRAIHLLWHLVAGNQETVRLSTVSEGGVVRVVVQSPSHPDTLLGFDTEWGYLNRASYTRNEEKDKQTYAWTFSNFKPLGGVIRASRVEATVDGEIVDEWTVQDSKPAVLLPEQLSNPYSPRKPFKAQPGAARHRIKFINGNLVGGAVLICFDDDPETVAIGYRAEQTVAVEDGLHHLTIVGWIPQISLKQPLRTESKPLSLRVSRDHEITIYADKNGVGTLKWEIK